MAVKLVVSFNFRVASRVLQSADAFRAAPKALRSGDRLECLLQPFGQECALPLHPPVLSLLLAMLLVACVNAVVTIQEGDAARDCY